MARGQGDRLVDRHHAALVEFVVAALRANGWDTEVEYTFNHFGERGSVDVLGFHALTRVLLVVEVKTRLTDLQAFLSSFGRKVRLLPGLVRAEPGWDVAAVGRLLVVADSTGNRSIVARHPAMFGTVFPDRAVRRRRWLRAPEGSLGAIWFVDPARDGRRRAPTQRVRRSRVA